MKSGSGKRSVNGSAGLVKLAKGNAGWNRLGISSANLDGTVDVTLDKRPGKGGVQVMAAARATAKGEYRFRVTMAPDRSLSLSVSKLSRVRERDSGRSRS